MRKFNRLEYRRYKQEKLSDRKMNIRSLRKFSRKR